MPSAQQGVVVIFAGTLLLPFFFPLFPSVPFQPLPLLPTPPFPSPPLEVGLLIQLAGLGERAEIAFGAFWP